MCLFAIYLEGDDFCHVVLLLVRRLRFLCESDVAVHIFCADDPGDFFHIRFARDALVVVVRALAHLEGNADRIIQAGAKHNLFAFRIPLDDARVRACVTTRVIPYRCAAINFSQVHRFTF